MRFVGGVHRNRPDLQARQCLRPRGRILQRKRYLEEWRQVQAALRRQRLDQPLERHVLVQEGV